MSILKCGPYLTKAGYVFNCYYNTDTKRNSSRYEHREVMEAHLKRKLKRTEIVHHIDGNPVNNDISNLELIESRSAHASLHGAAAHQAALLHLTCIECGVKFSRDGHDERGHRKKGKKGPFCGKPCAGRWSRKQQLSAGLVNLRNTSKNTPVAQLAEARP